MVDHDFFIDFSDGEAGDVRTPYAEFRVLFKEEFAAVDSIEV